MTIATREVVVAFSEISMPDSLSSGEKDIRAAVDKLRKERSALRINSMPASAYVRRT